jgi:hypothetical protein
MSGWRRADRTGEREKRENGGKEKKREQGIGKRNRG